MTRYFSKLAAAVKTELPPPCVLNGEIVLATPAGLGSEAAAVDPSRRRRG